MKQMRNSENSPFLFFFWLPFPNSESINMPMKTPLTPHLNPINNLIIPAQSTAEQQVNEKKKKKETYHRSS